MTLDIAPHMGQPHHRIGQVWHAINATAVREIEGLLHDIAN